MKIRNKNEFLFKLISQKITATAIVNVSPIEWGHFLLVAELEKELKQRLTFETIRLGIETINLFKNRYMRLMFNSLLGITFNLLY